MVRKEICFFVDYPAVFKVLAYQGEKCWLRSVIAAFAA